MYLVSQHSIRKVESLECTDLMCLSQRAVVGTRKLQKGQRFGCWADIVVSSSRELAVCTREYM